MKLYKHTIHKNKHRDFLAEKRRDPITGEVIQAGDEIVFCEGCGSVFLVETWFYIGKKHCQQPKTLPFVPNSETFHQYKQKNRLQHQRQAAIQAKIQRWLPYWSSLTSVKQHIREVVTLVLVMLVLGVGMASLVNRRVGEHRNLYNQKMIEELENANAYFEEKNYLAAKRAYLAVYDFNKKLLSGQERQQLKQSEQEVLFEKGVDLVVKKKYYQALAIFQKELKTYHQPAKRQAQIAFLKQKIFESGNKPRFEVHLEEGFATFQEDYFLKKLNGKLYFETKHPLKSWALKQKNVQAFSMTADQTSIAVANQAGKVRIYSPKDPTRNRIVYTVPHLFRDISLNADHRLLAGRNTKNQLIVFLGEKHQPYINTNINFTQVVWLKQNVLAALSERNTTYVYTYETYPKFKRIGKHRWDFTKGKVSSISPQGKQMVCTEQKNYIEILDLPSGELNQFCVLEDFDTSFEQSPVFSSDGKYLALEMEKHRILIWKL